MFSVPSILKAADLILLLAIWDQISRTKHKDWSQNQSVYREGQDLQHLCYSQIATMET